MPLADGGRERPTRPATARTVTRYGSMAMNWLSTGVPMMVTMLCRLSANPKSSAAKNAPMG
jgi:hypothetical protein